MGKTLYNFWNIKNIYRQVISNLPVLEMAIAATFQINNAKLYVPVVVLSVNYNIRFLENIMQEFKRTISRNEYGSEITT